MILPCGYFDRIVLTLSQFEPRSYLVPAWHEARRKKTRSYTYELWKHKKANGTCPLKNLMIRANMYVSTSLNYLLYSRDKGIKKGRYAPARLIVFGCISLDLAGNAHNGRVIQDETWNVSLLY